MDNVIGIYIRFESVQTIKKLLNFLKINNYDMFIRATPSYIKSTYSYISINEYNKVVRFHLYDNFKYNGKYYISDCDYSIITDMQKDINEYLKTKFKKLLDKNTRKRLIKLHDD